MSGFSKEDDERKLFEFYIKHGYFPNDYGNFTLDTRDKKAVYKYNNKIDLVSKTNDKDEMDSRSLESERDLFLEALKNSNFDNHPKKLDVNTKKNNYKKSKLNVKHPTPKDKLDLHNLTRERALSELKSFIQYCVRERLSPVIIVHGKGFRSEGGISVLKDTVECYINTEGREYISHYSNAPPNLGGTGAKVVYIKY